MSLATRLGWGAWLLALSATDASAQAITRLDWQRADSATTCIDAHQLEAAVEAQLDADALSSTADAAIVIVGRVERTQRPRGFRAAVSVLRDGQVSGVRDVVSVGRDCRKLDDALVLVIAMALEQPSNAPTDSTDVASVGRDAASVAGASPPDTVHANVMSDAAPSTATDPPAAVARPVDAPRAKPTATPTRRSEARARTQDGELITPNRDDTVSLHEGEDRSRARWSASAGGAISSGWMPGLAGGASAALGWQASDRWSVELAGAWWPTGEQPTDAGSLHFAIGYGVLRICPMLLRTSVSIDACAGVSVGAITAEGRNFDRDNRSDQRLLLGATFATRVSVRIAGAWEMRGVLASDVPWLRDRYSVQVEGGERVQLHRVSVLVGAIGVELVARL